MKILFGLFLLLNAGGQVFAATAQARGLDSPLSVTIKMSKAVYSLQEPIDGLITITNSSSASFPATFDIQLFHEDTFAEKLSVEIKSFLPGDNKYNFKELGIPQTLADGQGHWRFVIVQKNVDVSYTAEAEFDVQP